MIWPTKGATAGTMTKKEKINDPIRACSRPENISRITDWLTIRLDAAPKPCTKRAVRSTVSEPEKAPQIAPAMNSPMPRTSARRRPKLSENGPMNSCPTPVPSTKKEITSCARVGSSGEKAEVSSGMAGRIESIENAIIDIIRASRTTSSPKASGRVGAKKRGMKTTFRRLQCLKRAKMTRGSNLKPRQGGLCGHPDNQQVSPGVLSGCAASCSLT
ncbi:MAG: hypothetical protein P8X69_06375 [Maritimibacter sp.]